jgi:sugar O-acyltransferase (sialic acid O-acetyltransferase NeuD family)
MVIVGAKGFAKEVLEVLHQTSYPQDKISFFDNVTPGMPDFLYSKFRVLKNEDEVKKFFALNEPNFTLGIGGPIARIKLDILFRGLGGKLTSTISNLSAVGHYGVYMGEGVNLMTGSTLTNDIKLGRGCLINLHCTIGHDCTIGNFVELSPGVHVSGNCHIGDYCNIGTNATILPAVTLGENVIVGAGAVVTKDVPSNSLVVGIPAKVIKEIPSIAVQ